MVSTPLSVQMSVRRELQALNGDVLRSAVAEADDLYIINHAFNILELFRLMSCNDLKLNREYMSDTPALVRKPSCSAVKDCVNSGLLLRFTLHVL